MQNDRSSKHKTSIIKMHRKRSRNPLSSKFRLRGQTLLIDKNNQQFVYDDGLLQWDGFGTIIKIKEETWLVRD
jgi:hypothetical protein